MARGEPLIRQWNLLKTLQVHRFGIGAEDLAQRLKCSKRQVQRDLNVMHDVGFPITFEERDFGKRFWKLEPNFIAHENLLLSVTECLSLLLSQKLLAPLSGTQFGDGLTSAMEKIKALLPRKTLGHFGRLSDTLFVKTTPFHDYSSQSKEISVLNKAIAERWAVKVCYAPPGREAFDAVLQPYGMVLLGAGLYCVGRLLGHEHGEDLRKLKLSRCIGVELTAQRFERPDDFTLEDCMQGSFGVFSSGEVQAVAVRFTGWAATSVREQQWHPTQVITEDGDGGVIAEFRLSDTTEFKRWVLGFGRHAVVLQPEDFAADVAAELAAAAEAYEAEVRTEEEMMG